MKKLIPLLLAVLLLTGCMGGSKLSLRIEHDPVANVYGFADIEVTANQDAKFQFVANGGEIIHQHKNRAIWNAPREPGVYTIDVIATGGNETVRSSIDIKVVEFPVDVMAMTLENDGIGGKNARLRVLNLTNEKVTAFRVKILMMNNFGERIHYLGDYQFRGQSSDANLLPHDPKWYAWSLYFATGVSDIVAYVYEAALEDGTVLRLYEQ